MSGTTELQDLLYLKIMHTLHRIKSIFYTGAFYYSNSTKRDDKKRIKFENEYV